MISFPSDLGWTGLLIANSKIARIKFGFQKEFQLLRQFDEHFDVRRAKGAERKWVSQLQNFAAGKKVDFLDIPVDFSDYSKFQATVLRTCRKIPYGQTMSYGTLAAKSKSPGAARAVGSAMKKNKYPLVIPCHRVVASTGIGGYSAGDGISIKRQLLQIEGVVM